MKTQMNKVIPFISAVAIFLLLAIIYMAPSLEGKGLHQHDVVQHKGMSKELADFRAEQGEEALWTNSMFGGMPGYMISTKYPSNKLRGIHRVLLLNYWRPVNFIFLYLIGFYIALLAFRVNPWLSIAGAIAYGFSAYFIIIIEAGHISKVFALGYMPPIIAGVHLAFKGKYLRGALLTGIFLSLQILVIHFQITYYTFLIIVIYAIYELVATIKEKTWSNYIKASSVLAVFAAFAILTNLSILWTSYEYSKFSIRGKSELSTEKENRTSGLDRDYATQWSYGKAETFNLLIPNFHGGSSAGPLSENSETYKFLSQIQGKSAAKKAIKSMPTYWGDQPITSGPVYLGAVVVFLFILSLFLVRGRIKWWLVTASVLGVLLSWGSNFQWFTDLFFDYVPGYNKFRAVSMTLIIVQFSFPLLAIIGVDKMLKGEFTKMQVQSAVKYSFYIVGGLCLFFLLFANGLFNFEAAVDQQYIQQGYTDFVDALQKDRLSLFRKDAFRTLVFVGLTAGILLFYLKDKLQKEYFIAVLGILILVDLYAVDKRYLNADDFVPARKAKEYISEAKVNKLILEDKSSYRVLNLSVSTFNDATTSYFHQSIGGYHGAKLRRYQELIENGIQPELQALFGGLRSGSMSLIDSTLMNSPILNMLNTKYLIYNADAPPIRNWNAYGNAWFVSSIENAKNADEEIAKVNEINPQKQIVVADDFMAIIEEQQILPPDSNASIELISYQPNRLVYRSSNEQSSMAVFSEIYYPKGWEAFIDGEPVEHIRANYILRALAIPSGDHEVVFAFNPRSYHLGERVGLIFSLILLLGLFAYLIREGVKKKKV